MKPTWQYSILQCSSGRRDVQSCELDTVLAAADGNAVAARKRLGTTTSVGSCKLTQCKNESNDEDDQAQHLSSKFSVQKQRHFFPAVTRGNLLLIISILEATKTNLKRNVNKRYIQLLLPVRGRGQRGRQSGRERNHVMLAQGAQKESGGSYFGLCCVYRCRLVCFIGYYIVL